MKNMKKMLAMVMAVMMVLSMAITTSAAGGSITIEDAVEGQTYSAYQILHLERYDEETDTYTYKANSAWAEWLATQEDYVIIDANGYVTWKEAADVAEFAKLAQAQVEAEKMTADATAKAESTTVVLEDLDLGYYLVDTTTGTLCSLDTVNGNVIMQEKNETPEVDKVVKEDSKEGTEDAWGKINDAEIGQLVEYKTTITVEAGTENYVLKDKMTDGLTFNNDVVVKIGDVVVDDANYSVDSDDPEQTFVVKFKNEYIATLADGTKLDIYYTATLNENAIVGLNGNTNEVYLDYGDETNPSHTPKDTTTTYTWDMKVVKYTVNDGKETTLAGATFKLSTDPEGENVINFHTLEGNIYEVCVDADCDKTHVKAITTDTTGTFKIEGLDAGTYYLTETAAPSGYNKLTAPVEVVITGATEDETTQELTYTTVEKRVLNLNGTELPSTGGMGLTMIYVVGGVMVAAAVILLVTKKRMSIDE